MYVYINVLKCMHAYVYIYIYIYMHIHMHMYICTYIYAPSARDRPRVDRALLVSGVQGCGV